MRETYLKMKIAIASGKGGTGKTSLSAALVTINHQTVVADCDVDTANLEGRVVGENVIMGNVAKFPGTIQTGICKVFDYGVGSTGLSEQNALQQGFDTIETVVNASLDKPGFMQGKLLITKLEVNKTDGNILGDQVIGPGEVSKQVAIWAMAIKGNLTVDDME